MGYYVPFGRVVPINLLEGVNMSTPEDGTALSVMGWGK